jgi:hypothetical protein
MVLLDHDAHGRAARDRLLSGFQFPKGDALTYHRSLPVDGCEAEWLIASELLERFFASNGEQGMASKQRIIVQGQERWAYGIHHTAKEAFARFVEEKARPGELKLFLPLLELIRARADKAAA